MTEYTTITSRIYQINLKKPLTKNCKKYILNIVRRYTGDDISNTQEHDIGHKLVI